MVPSLLALTPLPAVAELTPAGSSRGGHSVAQEEVHMIVPPLSDANSYSVNPFESTSTVPAPGTDFVPMRTEPGCALGELPPLELGAAFLAQADNAISVAAEAIQIGRVVLIDDFTFVLLRGGGSPARQTLSSRRIRNWEFGRVPGSVHSSSESQSSMSWPSPRIGQQGCEAWGGRKSGGDASAPAFSAIAERFPADADQNSSEGPVLLAVHQDLGEGSSLRVARSRSVRRAAYDDVHAAAVIRGRLASGGADAAEDPHG
jgi:hypothetical protein